MKLQYQYFYCIEEKLWSKPYLVNIKGANPRGVPFLKNKKKKTMLFPHSFFSYCQQFLPLIKGVSTHKSPKAKPCGILTYFQGLLPFSGRLFISSRIQGCFFAALLLNVPSVNILRHHKLCLPNRTQGTQTAPASCWLLHLRSIPFPIYVVSDD